MALVDCLPLLPLLSLTAVAAVALAPSPGAAAEPARPGFGGWKFGMTKEQVRQVPECSPYKEVPSTGGLECPAFKLDGRTMNISFVFGPSGLDRIQVWAYEGRDQSEAVKALAWALSWYRKTFGPLESPSMPEVEKADADSIAKWLATAAPGAGLFKGQFAPKTQKPDAFTFTSLIRHPEAGWFVFLYFQPPRK